MLISGICTRRVVFFCFDAARFCALRPKLVDVMDSGFEASELPASGIPQRLEHKAYAQRGIWKAPGYLVKVSHVESQCVRILVFSQ